MNTINQDTDINNKADCADLKNAAQITSGGQTKRFAVNVIVNGFVFISSTLINIWYTPFLIRHLGIVAYSFVPLSYSIATYFTLASTSMSGAIARYFTIEYSEGNFKEASTTFNTSLFGLTSIALFTIMILLLCFPYVHRVFSVPEGYETSFFILLTGTILSVLLSLLSACFSVTAHAKERLDYGGYIEFGRNLLRVAVVYLTFIFVFPQIGFVGVATFVSSLFAVIVHYFLWRHLTPQIVISVRNFKFSKLWTLLSTSFWFVIGQTGTLLLINVDLIIVNTQCGPEEAGRYGSLLLFSTLLRTISGVFGKAIYPPMLNKFAQGDTIGLTSLAIKAVRLKGLFFAFPIAIIGGLSHEILILWLGDQFASLHVLLTVMVCHLIVSIAMEPLIGIAQAYNRIRFIGIVMLICGIVNIILGTVLTNVKSLGSMGTAIAGAVVLLLKNGSIIPIYTASILGVSKTTFLKAALPGVIVCTFLIFFIYTFKKYIPINFTLPVLILFVTGILLIYAVITFFVLDKEEKKFFLTKLPMFKNREF